jgi:hypothetical protein
VKPACPAPVYAGQQGGGKDAWNHQCRLTTSKLEFENG